MKQNMCVNMFVFNELEEFWKASFIIGMTTFEMKWWNLGTSEV